MARAYMVSYDLQAPGQNYNDLIAELEDSDNWWHYLKSSWIVITDETAQELSDRLIQHIDQNDKLLVIQVCDDSQGWLPPGAWEWIAENVPSC